MDYFNNLSAETFWSDVLETIVMSIVSILVLFILTKIMGKKQISQLSFFDYAIGISIGSIAAETAVSMTTPFHLSVIAMIIYGLMSVLVSLLSMKSIRARRLLVGTPVTLIRDGKFLQEALTKSKIDVNELLSEARQNGYFDPSQISHCVMETNGKFSFIPKSRSKPLTAGDAGVNVPQATPLANVIIDGKVMEYNLKAIGKSGDWLKAKLSARGIEINEILLATLSEEYQLNLFKRTSDSSNISLFD